MSSKKILAVPLLACIALLAESAMTSAAIAGEGDPDLYSLYVDRAFPENLYWGDMPS